MATARQEKHTFANVLCRSIRKDRRPANLQIEDEPSTYEMIEMALTACQQNESE